MAKQTVARDAAYERRKAGEAARQREMSKAGRDIGDIPAPADPKRREAALASYTTFRRTYFADIFYLPDSPDHEMVSRQIEDVTLNGGLSAVAMPRGCGKTSMCVIAAIFAILKGVHRYVTLIGATATHAQNLLESITIQFETNELLADDFPEVCLPIRALEGIKQRRLLYKGERVEMEFTAERMVLPNIPGSAASEATVDAVGLTGAIRGKQRAFRDGSVRRPSFALIDDPQTEESATSKGQCDDRESIINSAVLGLAGPGKEISALCPVTVIAPDDLADRLLDRQRNPQWRGIRTRMVQSWPDEPAEALWGQYFDILSESLRCDQGTQPATDFYAANREAMDSGFVVSWPDRKSKNDLSAQQHVMNLRFQRGEAAFQAEYQNEPLRPKVSAITAVSDALLAEKVNHLERHAVPAACTHITAFVDVQQTVLWYMVCAWEPYYTGYVIDYGSFPDQGRSYYTLSDIRRPLQEMFPGRGLEGTLYAGLHALVTGLCTKEWTRPDGITMRAARVLIDANWGKSTDTVYRFAQQTPFAAVVMPSHGRGISAKAAPMETWQKRPGEEHGQGWVVSSVREGRSVRHVVIDTNFWKTFAAQRFQTPMGDRGCLTLWGDKPEQHRMLKDHLTAETAVETSGRGRDLTEWSELPGRDNHWFDCLVGCHVAASMCGIRVFDGNAPAAGQGARPFSIPAHLLRGSRP